MIVELSAADLEEIVAFEQEAFAPNMQASRETFARRFALGHIALGARAERLHGVISFSYGRFDPADPSTLPDSFAEWSMQLVPAEYNTAFIYNLGVLADRRGSRDIKALALAAIDRAERDGCRYVIGEGPIPSYAGTEHIHANPDIHTALDTFAAGGPPPPNDLLFRDPHLALYRRISPCSIIRVIAGFLPADTASGGFRAMLFRDLRNSAER